MQLPYDHGHDDPYFLQINLLEIDNEKEQNINTYTKIAFVCKYKTFGRILFVVV